MGAGDFAIGIDIGGTNVRAGAVARDGRLLAWAEAPIEAARGPEHGLARITALVEEVLAGPGSPGARLRAIGIGATGPVDRARGAIQNPYTLPGWEDVDVVGPLTRRFGAPTDLENDADAAALGECWLGAGRSYRRVVALTVGTGVGYAHICDGRIQYGLRGEHPEGGHLPVDPHGPPCYCGARGCLEALAAGPAIAARAQALAAAHPQSAMLALAGSPAAIDARTAIRAARLGDPAAAQVVAETAEALGLGITSILTLLLPDCILLGGGVMEESDLFLPGITAVVARHSVLIPAAQVPIVPMQLGGQAGVIGAARAGWNLLQE